MRLFLCFDFECLGGLDGLPVLVGDSGNECVGARLKQRHQEVCSAVILHRVVVDAMARNVERRSRGAVTVERQGKQVAAVITAGDSVKGQTACTRLSIDLHRSGRVHG